MSFDYKSQETTYPIGEDAWKGGKEGKVHPELHSTGYGTVDRPWSDESSTESSGNNKVPKVHKVTKKEESNTDSKEQHNFAGHTIHHSHSIRSVKRDLNDI
ncbi:hypothetical protein BD770DRAFT_394125 [Pilaira anomala]|nr:hypothetical protein BD770DRAFT_394125 [Pilaira anomala]